MKFTKSEGGQFQIIGDAEQGVVGTMTEGEVRGLVSQARDLLEGKPVELGHSMPAGLAGGGQHLHIPPPTPDELARWREEKLQAQQQEAKEKGGEEAGQKGPTQRPGGEGQPTSEQDKDKETKGQAGQTAQGTKTKPSGQQTPETPGKP